jgi:hypothetical protein
MATPEPFVGPSERGQHVPHRVDLTLPHDGVPHFVRVDPGRRYFAMRPVARLGLRASSGPLRGFSSVQGGPPHRDKISDRVLRPPTPAQESAAPDLTCRFGDQAELGQLLVAAERVTLHSGREAALR